MKKLLIPAFCMLHMAVLFWWTLPHSFGEMVAANAPQATLEVKFFKGMMLYDNSKALELLRRYIDVTGSQQYWDFFAPQSPKYHQYLSVCASILSYPDQGRIACQEQALFSNLEDEVEVFQPFGSDRSRLYRLTENLVNLEDPQLLQAFTQFYRKQQLHKAAESTATYLVLHQFELHPELNDLPKEGYRMDKVLWISR